MLFKGRPVWVGQVSRDIGIRFTVDTWNLTTHRIDPHVDDTREYLLQDLFRSRLVSIGGGADEVMKQVVAKILQI